MAPSDLVLISGAGPAGLVLALALRRNEVNIRIIDRELGPRRGERGAGLSGRSLELHKILGTFSEIMAIAGSLPPMREHDPKDPYKVVRTFNLMPFNEANPNAPWRNIAAIGQNHQERILREQLEQAGTSVEFGSELRTFTQSESGVSAEIVKRDATGKETIEKVVVSWLVGADGGRSVVRKTLQVAFLGETRNDQDMVLADLRVRSAPSQFWDLWGSRETKFLRQRPSSQDPDIVSLNLMGNVDVDELVNDPEALVDELHSVIGRQDVKFGEVIWLSKYRPNIRMVDKVRVGRVFLVGDAAHCHPFSGGQGLNSSIQDSFNLAWKLALVHKGIAHESLLDTYGQERLPVIAQMLNKTTDLLKYTLLDPRGTATQPIEAEIRKDMNQLGVNYRSSPLVYYEPSDGDAAFVKMTGYNRSSETDALPGDRAPEAPGLGRSGTNDTIATSLFDVFSPSRHTALIFSDLSTTTTSMEQIAAALRSQPLDSVQGVLIVSGKNKDLASVMSVDPFLTLVDREGHAYRGYHAQPEREGPGAPLVVVVRPDGVIGARFRGSEGIGRYFRGVFNGPRTQSAIDQAL